MAGRAGRPKTTEKKTTISINEGLSGWLEFRGREYARGMSGYLNALAERDRKRVLEDEELADLADCYRAFCKAVGYDAELAGL